MARLNENLGGDWSFDVQRHHRNGGGIEVTAELKSNGNRVQHTGTSVDKWPWFWHYQCTCMRSMTPWSAAASLAASRRSPSRLRSNEEPSSKRPPIR